MCCVVDYLGICLLCDLPAVLLWGVDKRRGQAGA